MEGFAGTLGAKVSTAAQDIGHLGWLLSFTISFILYYGICKMWPTTNQRIVREMGLGWEFMATTSETIDAVDGMNETVEEMIVKGNKV
jgi:NCS1 family nucleobase:cation symporter-1